MTMTSMAKALGDLRKKLAGTTGEIRNEISSLRDQIKEREQQLSHARGAPYPPAELADRMRAWLRAHLDYREHELGRLVPSSMGPTTPQPNAPGGNDEALLFILVRDAAEAAIPAFIERLGDYGWGPSAAERPSLIARLENELAQLQAAEESLIDEAAANDVVISHRPEVIQRRQAEAARRKREEDAVAARKTREEALNRAHEEQRVRGRAVPSPYLRQQ